MQDHDNWAEYRRLVLSEIERLTVEMQRLDVKLQAIRVDDIPTVRREITMLQVKSGVWGAVAGAIPAVIVIAFSLAKNV